MTIRRLSFLIGALTFLLVASLAGVLLWKSVSDMLAVEREKGSALVRAELSKTVIELSLERSVIQVTLSLDDPIAAQYRAIVDGQRRKAVDGFARIRALAGDDARYTGFLQQVDRSLAALDELRRTADRLLALPRSQRDPSFVGRWAREVPGTIAALERLGSQLRSKGADVPYNILRLEQLQHLAWAIREYGGRERTIMAIALARSEALSEVDATRMAGLNDTVLRRWSGIDGIRPFLAPALDAQVGALERGYFQTYDGLRRQVITAGQAGSLTGYPVSFTDFFTQSSEALALAERLSAAAADATIDAWRDLRRDSIAATISYGLLMAGALAFALWTWRFLSNGIAARLVAVAGSVSAISKGDYDRPLPAKASGWQGDNEVGAIIDSLGVLRASLVRARHLETQAIEDREAAARERAASLVAMAETVESETGRIVAQSMAKIGTMTDRTGQMTAVAQDVGQEAVGVSAAMQQVLANAETVGAATEELSVSVREIGDRAQRSVSVAQQADVAGGRAASEIGALAEAVQRIRSVTEMIATIAGQTNLLALNATIEAARAGEAGKGFAVVAGEVKALAAQTAKSTDEIDTIVREIEQLTGGAVGSVNGMTEAIAGARQSAEEIGVAVEQQLAATREISAAVLQVIGAVRDVSGRMERVTGEAARNDTLASGVDESARDVRENLQGLRDVLVRAIRSAAPEVNRRSEERFTLDADCDITLGNGQTVRTSLIDISRGGARLAWHLDVEPGGARTLRTLGLDIGIGRAERTLTGVRVVFADPLDDGTVGHLVQGGAGAVGSARRA